MFSQNTAMLRLRTPEGVLFAYRLATPISRMLAWSIDTALITAANVALMGIVLQFLGLVNRDWALAAAVIGQFTLAFGYWIACEWKGRGRTLGKRVLGLRVMDAQALPLALDQVVIRTILRMVDALPGLYAFGGLAAAVTPKCRRLGDIAAGTVVVHTRRPLAPPLETVQPGKYNSFRAHPLLAARLRHAVSPELAAVALEALFRREHFEPQARIELFTEMADYFRRLAPFPETAAAGLSSEQYVRNVVEILYVTEPERPQELRTPQAPASPNAPPAAP